MASMISNELLREKFLRQEKIGEVTAAEVAGRCGWEAPEKKTGRMKPDSSRVNRTLGVVAENGTFRTEITEESAVLLARALHLDPWEVGL